ncbi:hypothetical protein ACFS07_26965 [Undibacterium arcticum]
MVVWPLSDARDEISFALVVTNAIQSTGENQMFKKLLLAVATLVATMGFAFAQVDVNKADQTALDGIKGIGPKNFQGDHR